MDGGKARLAFWTEALIESFTRQPETACTFGNITLVAHVFQEIIKKLVVALILELGFQFLCLLLAFLEAFAHL